jgi:hypothetical protein
MRRCFPSASTGHGNSRRILFQLSKTAAVATGLALPEMRVAAESRGSATFDHGAWDVKIEALVVLLRERFIDTVSSLDYFANLSLSM